MQESENDNPYAASDVPHDEQDQSPPLEPQPRYRLFSPNAVAIASFLGSCVAGGIVIAINYARLGKKGESRPLSSAACCYSSHCALRWYSSRKPKQLPPLWSGSLKPL